MTGGTDRLALLLRSKVMNGVNFVERLRSSDDVAVRLRIHLLNDTPVSRPIAVTVTGGQFEPTRPVLRVEIPPTKPPTVEIELPPTLDRSRYTVTVMSALIDPVFSSATAVLAGTDAQDPPTFRDGPPSPEPVSIDYLAKDYTSFRAGLLDFSAARYPHWIERSEADFGVMFLEALAATADELSYQQDRIAAEATLATATQRVSMQRLARLVDYEPVPALSGTTILQLSVANPVPAPFGWAGPAATSPTPTTPVGALTGNQQVIHFAPREDHGPAVALRPEWNRGRGFLDPYWWDRSRPRLDPGTTVLWIHEHNTQLEPGVRLLLDTPATQAGAVPHREIVTVRRAVADRDRLLGVDVTRVELLGPTTQSHDLRRTSIAGNIVDAVEGRRVTETFVIPGGRSGASDPCAALARLGRETGRTGGLRYRYSLGDGPLSWVRNPASRTGDGAPPYLPRIDLRIEGGEIPWTWERSLLDCGVLSEAFTLSPERYVTPDASRGLLRADTQQTVAWQEYADGEGTCICFGDDAFGRAPVPGTIFTVTYWVTAGAAGNVPADVVTVLDSANVLASCTNPFAVVDGSDAATVDQTRIAAPRARMTPPVITLARPGDYVDAAQSVAGVNRARCVSRWTGSWATLITTVDPDDDSAVIPALAAVSAEIDGRLIAGRHTALCPAGYFTIDLHLGIVRSKAVTDHAAAAAVHDALSPGLRADGTHGFFDRSLWEFGQPLDRSALVAAVLVCPEVVGIDELRYARPGDRPDGLHNLPSLLAIPAPLMLRVDADRLQPGRGALHVRTRPE